MVFRDILHSVGVFALVVCAACDRGVPASRADRTLPVYVEVVVAEPATPALAVPGVVEARSSRLLAFRYAGRISRLCVAEGARVDAGDPIAELDRAALERAERAAQSAVQRAERRLAETAQRSGRQRQLIALASDAPVSVADAGIGSAVQATELRFARVALADARARLAAGVLRAPVAGIVGRPYLAEGDDATPGTPVVRLFERDSLVIRSAVPQPLLPLLHRGGSAEVRFGGAAARRLPGTVAAVADAAEAGDGSVPFEARIASQDGALLPGTVVEVEVAVAEREAAFSIPLAAVRRGIDAQPFAFVVVPAGDGQRIARRRIGLAGMRGDRATVSSGLAVGDRVVTLGQDLVTVGDAVTIVGEGP